MQHRATVKALSHIIKWQADHQEEDARHFTNIAKALANQPTKDDLESFRASIEEGRKLLATKADLDALATKTDVAEVVTAWRTIKLSAVIVSGGGKWTFRFILALAALFGAWAVFKGGVVAILASLIQWVTKS